MPCSTTGMAAATTPFARQIGIAVKEKIGRTKRARGPWYNSLMAAASHALAERIPLVDLIVEVRDARVLLTFLLLHSTSKTSNLNYQTFVSFPCLHIFFPTSNFRFRCPRNVSY